MEATWKGPAGGGYVVEPWEGDTVEARTLSGSPNHLEEARTRTLSALVEARTLTGLYERAFSQNWPKPS